jgi:hypothetical protein
MRVSRLLKDPRQRSPKDTVIWQLVPPSQVLRLLDSLQLEN